MSRRYVTLTNTAGSVRGLLVLRRPRVSVCAAIVAVTVIGTADAKAAQQSPPIHGVTGTVATEATVRETHEGARKIFAKAADGIGRLFGLKRRSTVPSGDAGGDEALRGLKEGDPVLVVNTNEGGNLTAEEIDRLGAESLQRMEGEVTFVNPGNRTISIQLANGTRQALRLADRAAADAGQDINRAAPGTADVIVYFKDEAGRRIALVFTRVR
jgi:hypothetical protein